MKNIFLKCCLAVLVLATFVACGGPTEVDPRDAFIGAYSYEATGNADFYYGPLHWDIPLNEQGTFTISKVGDQDKVVIKGYYDPINATVSGNQLVLESLEYDTMYGDIEFHLVLNHNKATLADNKLTWSTEVDGIGQYNGLSTTGTGSVSMVATKQ